MNAKPGKARIKEKKKRECKKNMSDKQKIEKKKRRK